METASYTSFDGTELAFRHWKNDEADTCAVILHGIQSHSGWYEGSARYFFENGLEAAALDRRGSGMNASDRGDMPSYSALVEDIRSFIELMKRTRGIAKYHLVGISWGGKLSTVFCLAHGKLVQSQVLLSPGLFSKVDFSVAGRLSIALHCLFRPTKTFAIPINRAEMFTANPERIEYVRNDDMFLRRCTARFFFESYRMEKLIERKAEELETPTFLGLPGIDDIVDNEKVRAVFDRFGTSVKRLKCYENAHHTLEFEEDPLPVFEDVLKWIRSF
jgi:alpha-beta hydrolase superfamily lysophospholipase